MTRPDQHVHAESASRIRPATPADIPAILALAVDTRMFLPDETGTLQEEFDGVYSGQRSTGYALVVWTETADAVPVGVAYLGPNALSERAWDLWMIAVAPERQGQGIGAERCHDGPGNGRRTDGRSFPGPEAHLQGQPIASQRVQQLRSVPPGHLGQDLIHQFQGRGLRQADARGSLEPPLSWLLTTSGTLFAGSFLSKASVNEGAYLLRLVVAALLVRE